MVYPCTGEGHMVGASVSFFGVCEIGRITGMC